MSPGATSLFTPADSRRLDRLALLVRKAARGEARGERRARRIGAGGEFADHRGYVPGDDLRYVDWNVYGRHGDLVVKRFEAEENVRVLLVLDRSPSMEGAKSSDARRLAGALAHVALRRRDAVDLAFLPALSTGEGGPVESFRGPARLDACHSRIASVPLSGVTRHAEDLRRVLAAAGRRGPAILFSDFFDPAGAVKGLAMLAGHGFETTAVHVVDPADATLPEGEAFRCVDRETGEALDLDATPDLAERVLAAWRRRAERLRAWCAARGVGYQRADAGRPFWDVVREMLRGGVGVAG